MDIDALQINFSGDNLLLLNICIGIVMFGVALELTVEDFLRIIRYPKLALIGLGSQFILLPLITFLLIVVAKPHPSVALGMILVAACPGGNVSNFMASLSNANAALSISLTAVATLFTFIMTPINFTLWGNLYPPTAELLQSVEINFWVLVRMVLMLLVIPVGIGMTLSSKYPLFTHKIARPVKIFSLIAFGALLVVAVSKNYDLFINEIHRVFGLVFIHNTLGFIGGYLVAYSFGLHERDRRAISLETGLQNSAFALVLIFDFFSGLGGMAMVAAWWGIWHLISGLSLSFFWANRPTS